MKLPHRLVLCGASILICVSLVHISLSTSSLSHLNNLPVQVQHPDDVIRPLAPGDAQPADGDDETSMEASLGAIRGHLAVMRKELEYIKSTSNLSKQSRDKLLYERLVNDSSGLGSHHLERLAQMISFIHDNQTLSSGKQGTSKPISGPQAGEPDPVSEVNKEDENHVQVRSLTKPPPEIKEDNFVVNVTLTAGQLEELTAAVVRSKKRRRGHRRRTAGLEIHKGSSAAWQVFHNHIRQHELYGTTDHVIDDLLHDLAYKTIVGLHEIGDLGTQLKLVFKLNYGGQALFKPMRITKDTEANPNHYMYDDMERHHAEIAAFHLDRVLNFRRVPPVAGRYINITHDIYRYASRKLKSTFFRSPANNMCFHGVCDQYCDSGHAVCGHPYVIEGSMAVWLPEDRRVQRKHWENPWAQSYSHKRQAEWEHNEAYCDSVKNQSVFQNGRRLMDLMDIGIFDFLTGNKDRHHYHTFDNFGNFTFTLLFDNGRGFGRPRHDEVGLIAPVRQCCHIRASTLKRLLLLHSGPHKLSALMRISLQNDFLAPVLNEHHLAALDRRLAYILHIVHECGTKNGFDYVIVEDGF